MTHEGRMRRGKLKHSKGLSDFDTEYFLEQGGDKMSEEEQKTEEAPAEEKEEEAEDAE